MSGNKDFIEILREIRGSAAPGQPITDGIWYELTTADTNGNPGIYGDILAKYGIIVGDGGAIEQIAASVQAALESEEASAQSANEAEAARDTILNMQVATGAPESAVTWDGTTLTVPKGDKGETGVSVESIVRTNGDGSAGTFDTYTITLTDASTSTFTVYNGVNGTNGVDGEIGPTGNGIVNITRTNGTGQAGTIDTYTITLSDASTSTFDVYNGVDGNDGANGLDGNGIATILRTNGNGAAGTIDTYTITYNDTTTTTFNVYNGANGINGLDGIDGTNGLDGRGIVGIARTSGTGQSGETDEYTITYTDASTSVFNVYNGTDGTNGTNGLDGTDGVDGVDGRGVVSLLRTSGTGLPGTTDTYTMTYTDATTNTLTVYNGADGTGSGDMSKNVYDTTNNGKVDTAEVAESVPWTGITDKPTTYPPETHTHDDLYEPANTNIQTHIASTSNPHSVTKAQVGLSDVDNTADNVKAVLSASKLTTGVDISLSGDATGIVTFDGSVNVDMVVTVANDSHTHDSRYYTESEIDVLLNDKADSTHNHDTLYEPLDANIQAHIASTNNPHSVTKAQVGLGDVDNTADSTKAVLSASKLTTARNVSMSGDATGTASFDGSADVDIVVTVTDDSHTHDGRYYTEAEVQASLPKVGFDTANVTSPSTGQLAWNQDERTLDLGLNGVTLQVGQETLMYVRNNTASVITNKTLCMATGTIGNSGRITVAPFDLSDAKYLIGMATEDIAIGADGYVTVFGKVRGIDTSMYTDGQVLYAAASGSLTSAAPTTGMRLPVAFVVHAHTSGTLFVRITNVDENSTVTVGLEQNFLLMGA